MRNTKALALALGLALVLLFASAPAAEARSLKQMMGWGMGPWGPWGGWGWGGGWDDRDPVGSGCWDTQTLQRYKDGETQWCRGGGRRRCDWGEWVGDCGVTR